MILDNLHYILGALAAIVAILGGFNKISFGKFSLSKENKNKFHGNYFYLLAFHEYKSRVIMRVNQINQEMIKKHLDGFSKILAEVNPGIEVTACVEYISMKTTLELVFDKVTKIWILEYLFENGFKEPGSIEFVADCTQKARFIIDLTEGELDNRWPIRSITRTEFKSRCACSMDDQFNSSIIDFFAFAVRTRNDIWTKLINKSPSITVDELESLWKSYYH